MLRNVVGYKDNTRSNSMDALKNYSKAPIFFEASLQNKIQNATQPYRNLNF